MDWPLPVQGANGVLLRSVLVRDEHDLKDRQIMRWLQVVFRAVVVAIIFGRHRRSFF